MNKEISVQPPVATATGGPNFRSLPISESPNRFIPRLEDVLDNNLSPQWEVIPTVGRILDFALTVRDNHINGGESATDYMHIDVAQNAGPFVVTSPNTAVTWQAGTNHVITWNVAGTIANGVNTPYVDILLSTDGGFTYPVTLAAGVPNDGSETIIVPNLPGRARIMVRGHNNIFYDISNTNFTITPTGSTFNATVSSAQTLQACKGATVTYTLDYQALNGFTGTTVFSVANYPSNAAVVFTPASISANGQVAVTVSTAETSAPGLYAMTVTMTSGSEVKTVTLHLNLLSTDFAQLQLLTPANGADTLPATVDFDWSDDVIASSYHFQVATDAAFANVVTDVVTQTSSYQAALTEATQYYWRVLGANAGCEGNYGTVNTFVTGDAFCNTYNSADVPLAISWGDPSVASASIEVDGNYTLQDIQVSMNITHSWIGDVVATLISPAGTEVVLFSRECGQDNNANVTFSDSGDALTCLGGDAAIRGILAPAQALSQLYGQSVNGTWTLQIADEEGGDGGELTAWSLNLCGLETVTAGLTQNKTVNFMVYPNPSSGSFNVQYTSISNSATVISVYDMRGRMIFNQSTAPASGLVSQPVQLNAQAGVYVVNVQQGSSKSSKKIVVQ